MPPSPRGHSPTGIRVAPPPPPPASGASFLEASNARKKMFALNQLAPKAPKKIFDWPESAEENLAQPSKGGGYAHREIGAGCVEDPPHPPPHPHPQRCRVVSRSPGRAPHPTSSRKVGGGGGQGPPALRAVCTGGVQGCHHSRAPMHAIRGRPGASCGVFQPHP